MATFGILSVAKIGILYLTIYIAKLKAEIDSLKQEISDYKSVHSKLRAAELERENTELRGKVRSYEDVIQRNNLWRFFHPLREKAVTRDEAR